MIFNENYTSSILSTFEYISNSSELSNLREFSTKEIITDITASKLEESTYFTSLFSTNFDVCNITCFNQGNCRIDNGSSICVCLQGYNGLYCENLTKDWTNIIIGVTIAVSLILVIIIITICIVFNIKQKRSFAGAYNPKLAEDFSKKLDLSHVLMPPPLERLI